MRRCYPGYSKSSSANNIGSNFVMMPERSLSDIDEDSLFEKAGDLIITRNKFSVCMIQNTFRVSIAMSEKVIGLLMKCGVIGVVNGRKQVLMNHEQFSALVSNKRGKVKKLPERDEMLLSDAAILNPLKNCVVCGVSPRSVMVFLDSLVDNTPPDSMFLVLCNYKDIRWRNYAGHYHFLAAPVIRSISDAFSDLYKELRLRMCYFAAVSAKNIAVYNERAQKQGLTVFSRIVCVSNDADIFVLSASDEMRELFSASAAFGIYFMFFSESASNEPYLGRSSDLLHRYTERQLFDIMGIPVRDDKPVKHKPPVSEPRKCVSEIGCNFDNLSGIEFEKFCAGLLEKNGFVNILFTKASGDHGADLLAEKDDVKYAIQCKCYSSNIGNKAVQEVNMGKLYYSTDVAVVMTNQYFTTQAKDEAFKSNVKLWDRDKLMKLLK